MAVSSPFRRWKRFFPEFETIHAAIVASDPGRITDAENLRHFKAEVVEFLCDAPDEELAKDYNKILDDLMMEYLITLNMVVPVKPSAAAASSGIAKAVAALKQHECEQISGFAMVTLARWRASGDSDIVEELDKLPDLVPVSRTPIVGQAPSSLHAAADSGKKTQGIDALTPFMTKTPRADTDAIAKTKTSCHASAAASDIGKKMPVRHAPPCHATPAASDIGKKKKKPLRDAPSCSKANPLRTDTVATAKMKTPVVLGNREAEIEKMKGTKRKFREGYQREADAKQQWRIQLIEAPKMPEQRPRKVHPILREHSKSRCGAPPCTRVRTVGADMAAITKT
jgi:hypothetical protein